MSANSPQIFSRGDIVFLVVGSVFVIGFLLVLLLPAVPHHHSQSATCMGHLKTIALGEILYANDNERNGTPRFSWTVSTNERGSLEYQDTPETWRHFQTLSNQLTTPKVLRCPFDRERTATESWQRLGNSNISYFVNLGISNQPWSSEPLTTPSILFGDRFLTTNGPLAWKTNAHGGYGTVAFADGSTRQVTTTDLQSLQPQQTQPLRLAFP